MKLLESDRKWVLTANEGRVTRIQIDFRVGIDLSDEEGILSIKIETPFNILMNGVDNRIEPGECSTLAPILCVFNASIEEIVILKSGELSIIFNNALSLNVVPDDEYEAWQISFPGRFLLVCSPGGNVSVFVEKKQNDNENIH